MQREAGVAEQVIEITRRISFYHTLATLQQADALFIPGSDDAKYTASKIYPYLSTQKPVLAVFNKASSALKILEEYGVENAFDYETVKPEEIINFLLHVLNDNFKPQNYNANAIENYSARQMARQECALFDEVIPIEKFKRTFGFIFSHPLGKKHKLKALLRFFVWQVQTGFTASLIVKPFISPVKFYARKGLTGVTGNIYTGLHEFNATWVSYCTFYAPTMYFMMWAPMLVHTHYWLRVFVKLTVILLSLYRRRSSVLKQEY